MNVHTSERRSRPAWWGGPSKQTARLSDRGGCSRSEAERLQHFRTFTGRDAVCEALVGRVGALRVPPTYRASAALKAANMVAPRGDA